MKEKGADNTFTSNLVLIDMKGNFNVCLAWSIEIVRYNPLVFEQIFPTSIITQFCTINYIHGSYVYEFYRNKFTPEYF